MADAGLHITFAKSFGNSVQRSCATLVWAPNTAWAPLECQPPGVLRIWAYRQFRMALSVSRFGGHSVDLGQYPRPLKSLLENPAQPRIDGWDRRGEIYLKKEQRK
jgi:hypothetical protein